MELRNLFYDPNIGLVSAEKFYRRLRDLGHKFKRKEVADFVKKQHADQVNRQIKKPEQFSSIVAPYNKYGYQFDIMNYDRYKIHHYKYILCVMDIHSRYAVCRPLTKMTMEYIMDKLEGIFIEMGVPENINCDLQFNAHLFLDYCEENNIAVHFSDKEERNKNAIIERFHRTLARMLQRWRQATNEHDWYRVLPDIVAKYNNQYHRTIKAKPIDVWNHLDANKQDIVKVENNFKVGDMVRIKYKKKVLEKGDIITHSKEEYLIKETKKGKFILTSVDEEKDLTKEYKPYELEMANIVQYKSPVVSA